MQRLFEISEPHRMLFKKLAEIPAYMWPAAIAKALGYSQPIPISPCLYDWSRHIDYKYVPEQSDELLYMFSSEFNLQYFGHCVLPLLLKKIWEQVVLLRTQIFNADAEDYFRIRMQLPRNNHTIYLVLDAQNQLLTWTDMQALAHDPEIEHAPNQPVLLSEKLWKLNVQGHRYLIYQVPCEFVNLTLETEGVKAHVQAEIREEAQNFRDTQPITVWDKKKVSQAPVPLQAPSVAILQRWLESNCQEQLRVLTDEGQWLNADLLRLGSLKHTRPECLHLGEDLPFTHTINGQTFVAGVAVETGLQQLFSGTPLFRLDKTGSCGAIVQPIWADNPNHLELLQKGRLFLSVAAAEVFYLNLIEAAEL